MGEPSLKSIPWLLGKIQGISSTSRRSLSNHWATSKTHQLNSLARKQGVSRRPSSELIQQIRGSFSTDLGKSELREMDGDGGLAAGQVGRDRGIKNASSELVARG
jgi:hypothetical protein